MKIFACHLLNDYSGSPKVLMQLIKGWSTNNIKVCVLTCGGKNGFLSNIPTISYSYYWYKWSGNSLIRLFNFIISQFFLFVKILALARKKDIIYINTVLPFGAALAGKIKGCRVIYHIHETSIKPLILKHFLFGITKLVADDVVYVSNYLSNQEPINKAKKHILYNSIEEEFYEEGKKKTQTKKNYQNILMICSLKAYKGVFEFLELTKLNASYDFKLVVNASQKEIDDFFSIQNLPQNIQIYPVQTNTHTFYYWADIVLNLSRTNEWIETFGLTVLEAMAYGIPAIVPPVGGIAELVEENENGALVDSNNISLLNKRLNDILNNNLLYNEMRKKSFHKINSFRENKFIAESLSILKFQPLNT